MVRDIDDLEVGQSTPAANINDDDVEVYSDNHGIAGVTAVAIHEDGSVTIVATVDYPASLKKGKYGPVKSDEITVEWGIVEFDPDFVGTPRSCDEVEGCSVEFTNLTTGATTPYAHSTWDFGDGTTPVVDQAIQNGQKVTHQYAKDGVFDVTLTMEDAEGVLAYQIEFDYITVGEGGAGNIATWSFDDPGCYPKHLPDSFFGEVVLGSLTGVPSEMSGVYYNDAGTWKFWNPVAPGNTLTTLVGGLSADYLVCVTGAIDWEIPLP
jgi:PKD repeat protein